MIDTGFFYTTILSLAFAVLSYVFLYVTEDGKILKDAYFEVWLYFILYGLNAGHLWKLFCSKVTKGFECGFYGHLLLSMVIWVYGFVVLGLSYTSLSQAHNRVNTALIIDQLVMTVAAAYEVWSIQDIKRAKNETLLPRK